MQSDASNWKRGEEAIRVIVDPPLETPDKDAAEVARRRPCDCFV